MSNQEFSLYEEEEKIIHTADEFIRLGGVDNIEGFEKKFLELLNNYKKLFKQSKRLIRMSDRMEAELATTKVELEKYSKKLKLQATTDSLTGLANRRRITSLLEKALIEVKENKKKDFNIIMLDIDFFKKVNDNYGHPMGDQVIKEVSHLMQAKISQAGVVGRFGGEEFLSIIYDENNNKVFNLADEIRHGIENKSTSLDGVVVNVTVSMGIASSSESQVFQELIDIADKRLYEAKKNGRNQVVFS